jgi:hypothetical protein
MPWGRVDEGLWVWIRTASKLGDRRMGKVRVSRREQATSPHTIVCLLAGRSHQEGEEVSAWAMLQDDVRKVLAGLAKSTGKRALLIVDSVHL